MRVIETDKQIIFAASKCGTSTFLGLQDSEEYRIFTTKGCPYRKQINLCKKLLHKSKKELIICIREPEERFLSGLYEVAFKQNCLLLIEQLVDSNADTSTISDVFNAYTDIKFWDRTLPVYLQSAMPLYWQNGILFNYQAELFCGNWLSHADSIKEYAQDTGYNYKIIDLSNLSKWLSEENLPILNKNEKNDIFYYMPKLKSAYKNNKDLYDSDSIFKAFADAFYNCPPFVKENFERYIREEKNMYSKLLSEAYQTK